MELSTAVGSHPTPDTHPSLILSTFLGSPPASAAGSSSTTVIGLRGTTIHPLGFSSSRCRASWRSCTLVPTWMLMTEGVYESSCGCERWMWTDWERGLRQRESVSKGGPKLTEINTFLGNARSIECGWGPSDLSDAKRDEQTSEQLVRGHTHCQNVSGSLSLRLSSEKPYLWDEVDHRASGPRSGMSSHHEQRRPCAEAGVPTDEVAQF